MLSFRHVCLTCEPNARPLPGERLSHGYCRFHALEYAISFGLASWTDHVEHFVRKWWVEILTIGVPLAYLIPHLFAWTIVGFPVVAA